MSSESWVQSVPGALERANPAHPSCAASEDQAAAAARAGACGPLTCIPATADRKAASSWHHSWSPYISFKSLKAWERGRLAVSVAASQFGFGGLHLDYALPVVRIAGIQPAPLLEKGRSSLSKNHKSVKRSNDSTEKKAYDLIRLRRRTRVRQNPVFSRTLLNSIFVIPVLLYSKFLRNRHA